MKGDEKVVASLNAFLADELAAVNQYILHAEKYGNWPYGKLRESPVNRAIEEMKRAEGRANGAYNAAIRLEGDSGDGGTRELMESILADGESRIDSIDGRRE